MSEKYRWVSERANIVPWSGVRKMFDLAQKYKDTISLSVGEPDFPTPQHIVDAAFEAAKKGYTHYTPNAGLMDFREAAAEKLEKENNIEADPGKEIIATVGAMGALALAILATINRGDEVLIPNPGFPSYEAQVLLAEGKPVYYPTITGRTFNMDLDELENLVSKKTKAIILNSPSNPTGAVFNDKQLRGITEIAVKNDLLVISDEAYEAITYDDVKHVCIGSLPKMKERTISIFSFSKTHAMTGWRIGFAVGNEKIIQQMIKLQEHLTAHPSSVSQKAATAALCGSMNHVKMMVKEYAKRRDILLKELTEISGIRCVKPLGTFYVFPNISAFKMSPHDFAMSMLEKAKVIIVPGTAFGSNGEGYIRISYATSREKIIEAMARIKKALKIGQ